MIAVPARSELGLQREMELIAPAVAVDWQSALWQQGGESAEGEPYQKAGISLIRRSFLQLVAVQNRHLLVLVPEGIHRVGGTQWRTMAATCMLA